MAWNSYCNLYWHSLPQCGGEGVAGGGERVPAADTAAALADPTLPFALPLADPPVGAAPVDALAPPDPST